MTQLTSCIDDDTLAVFADGALDATTRARVEAHLVGCDSCMEAVAAAALALDPGGGELEPVPSGALGKRFEVGSLIARGGMGVVHLGRDRATGRKVAIKCLRSELLEQGDELRQRFEREGEILRQLDHPNIVKVLTTVQDEERLHIVMEYVGGGCLRDQLLPGAAPLPLARLVRLGLELSDALARAHHLQVIHRDIKPENILIAEDGTPKLSDFGLARVGGQGLTRTGVLLGTVSYQSPEALWGYEVDERADIWALGITLYELLARRRPFEGRHPAAILTSILNQPVPSLTASHPELPARLVQLIERMLDKNPAARVGSMRQVGAELELVLQALQPAARASERRLPVRAPSAPPLASRPEHNLPAPGGVWIGREAELRELARVLASAQDRLVTIVGPAGVGKTHLAIEAARRLARGLEPFRELALDPQNVALGVYFVDLAQAASAESIVFAIARALGFQMAPQVEPRRQLFEYLRHRSLLLVLDNFERLIEGAGIVAELVGFAPRLRVLATSRKRMRLQLETILPLAGLAAAAAPQHFSPESVASSEAGQLFLTRAAELCPQLSLAQRKASDVARVCRGLQGSPLGLLLAAGTMDSRDLESSLVRLRQAAEFAGPAPSAYSLAAAARQARSHTDSQWALLDEERGEAQAHLLQVDDREASEGRQALQDVLREAWACLDDRGRAVLRRASIFGEGFSVQAAGPVLQASAADLEGLVRRALLQLDTSSGRYHLHDVVREHAARALRETSGEAEQTREAFARFYAAFLAEREAALRGNEAPVAAAEITRELGNVRAAWDYMIDAGEEAQMEQCIEALVEFYRFEGRLTEGEAALAAAAASLLPPPPESSGPWLLPSAADARGVLAGRALAARATLLAALGQHSEAVESARQAHALLEQGSREHERGRLLVTWGLSLCHLGHLSEGEELGVRGLTVLRSAPPGKRARALAAVGAQRGWLGLEEARSHLNESVALQRTSGAAEVDLQQVLPALAQVEVDLGNYVEAVRLFTEVLAGCPERGDRWLQAVCLQGLAEAQRRLGRYPEAEAVARRELELLEDCYPFAAGLAHARLAEILKEQGRASEAWACAQVAVNSPNAFTSAVAKLELADIASLRGEASEAKRYWAEAVETFERLDMGRGLAAAWEGLGWAALEEEQQAVAQQYFRQAGDLAAKLELRGQALSALAGYAASLMLSHQPTSAAELAALVGAAPATDAKTRTRRLEPLFGKLRSSLPSSDLDAAIRRGQSMDWQRALMEMA